MNEHPNAKNVVFFSGLGWPIQSTIQQLRREQKFLESDEIQVNFQTIDHMGASKLEDAVAEANKLVKSIQGPYMLSGYSIGTGIACQVAAYMESIHKPDQIVLFAPFRNLSNWLRVSGFKAITNQFIGDVLDSKWALSQTSAPIAICAGRKDGVILQKFSEELAQVRNANDEKPELYTFTNLDHGDILDPMPQFVASYADRDEWPEDSFLQAKYVLE